MENNETPPGASMPTSMPTTMVEQLTMKVQYLEMNMSLFQTQLVSSVGSIMGQIEELRQEMKQLSDQVSKLSEQVSQSSGQKTNKNPSIQIEDNPSLSPNLYGPNSPQTANPVSFKEILQTQEKEKEKEQGESSLRHNPIIKKPLIDHIQKPITDSSPHYRHYQFMTNIIQKLNSLTLSTVMSSKTIKYVSHFAINKAIIYPGASPEFVKTLFSYGLIQTIYPSSNMKELSLLPKQIMEAAKHYFGIVTRHQVYVRCYSTIAEITPKEFYPPINLIKFGTTKQPFTCEQEEKSEFEEDDLQYIMSNIRAQGIKIIFEEMNRTIVADEEQWTYFVGPTMCIYSVGRTSRQTKLFQIWYDRIKKTNMPHSEKTKKRICLLLEDYKSHQCRYCDEKAKEDKDYDEPEINEDMLK